MQKYKLVFYFQKIMHSIILSLAEISFLSFITVKLGGPSFETFCCVYYLLININFIVFYFQIVVMKNIDDDHE